VDVPNPGGQRAQQPKTQKHAYEKRFSFPVSMEEKGQAPFQDNMYAGMGFPADGLQTEKVRKADFQLTAAWRLLYAVQEQMIIGAQIQETLRLPALDADAHIPFPESDYLIDHKTPPSYDSKMISRKFPLIPISSLV